MDLSHLDDNQVIERAKDTRALLRVTPRGQYRDQLLTQMGKLHRELHRRGITNTVTEGGGVSLVAELLGKDEGNP